MALFLIYAIFLIAFFANSLVGYNLMIAHVTIATELVIYLLFLYSFVVIRANHKSYDFHLLPIFGFFLITAFCSILVNHVFNFQPILSLRLVLRFYFFYLAVINLGLTEDQFKKINKLLFILFIIQLPVSAVKFYFFGIAERTHGTYSGGGLTTSIPIMALGYLSGYHAFHRARPVYFLLGIGFILYGIVGAKAALFFLLPVTFFGLYYLTYIRGKNVDVGRHVFVLVMILLFSVVVAGTIIKVNQRLNAQREVGGEIDFSYALKYSQGYTTGTHYENPEFATGRFSTTMLTLDTIRNTEKIEFDSRNWKLNNKKYEQQFVYFLELILSQAQVDYCEVEKVEAQYETEAKDGLEVEDMVDKNRAKCSYKEKTEYGQ